MSGFNARNSSLTKIFRLMGNNRKYIVIGVCFAVLSEFFLVVGSGLGAYAVGVAIRDTSIDRLRSILVFTILIIVLIVIFQELSVFYVHKGSFYSHDEIRLSLYDAFVRLAPAYFLTRRSGDVTIAATSDIESVELYTSHHIPSQIVAFCVPAAAIGTIIAFSWQTGLVLLPFLGLLITVPIPIRRRCRIVGDRLANNQAAVGSETADTIMGIEVLTAYNADRYQLRRIMEHERRLADSKRNYAFWAGLDKCITELLVGLGTVVALVIATLTIGSNADAGIKYIIVIIMIGAALAPLVRSSSTAQELGRVAAAARRVLEILSEPAVVDFPKKRNSAVAQPCGISFTNVWFTYPGAGEPALRGVNFAVEAGEFIAVVGGSGAGKTTCANLLLRAWDPDSGSIMINDQKLSSLAYEQLSEIISVVPQDVFLTNRTVEENISLGRAEITGEDARLASQMACADEFVIALPHGYQEELGDNGVRLSGGQRQRLSIARALALWTPVLLMDEPSSNIDSVSEAYINRAIRTTSRDRTVIVITHRPSTIRMADRVIVLHAGEVVESGSYDELMKGGGFLSGLLDESSPKD